MFGNRGQVDYAAANDALDKIAWWLGARVEGRVLSVNWGPWQGTGMVSAELAREHARRGMGLVPPDAGVAALLDELRIGSAKDRQVVLMCGDAEPLLATPSGRLSVSSLATVDAQRDRADV